MRLDDPAFRAQLDPNRDPVVLEQRSQAMAAYNPAEASKLFEEAQALKKEMQTTGIAYGKAGPIDVPGYSDMKAHLSNVAENPKWFGEQADAARARAAATNNLHSIRDILESYQSGAASDWKAKALSYAKAAGFDMPSGATSDPAAFETFLKGAYTNIFNQLSTIGGRAPGVEIRGLEHTVANPSLQPEANRQILSKLQGVLDYEDKFYRDISDANEKAGHGLNRADFMNQWAKNPENSLRDMTAKEYGDTAVRGANPPSWTEAARQGRVGHAFILEPGSAPGITTPMRVRFEGLDANGQPKFTRLK